MNVLASSVFSLPRNNWRFPLYVIAAQQSQVDFSGSGLFWDELHTTKLFHKTLTLDTTDRTKNHFFCEVGFSEALANQQFISGSRDNFSTYILGQFNYKAMSVFTSVDINQLYKAPASDFAWKKDRVQAGRIDEAYAQFKISNGFLRFGKMNRNWGPFVDRSLIVSSNPFSYDAFEWQLCTTFLEFRQMIAAFPQAYSNFDTFGSMMCRYFSAHSLSFLFGSWASIGMTESLVFGQSGGFPHVEYLNPFTLYCVEGTNGGSSANLMLSFQGWCHPLTDKITLKAQVLLDDFQVDNNGPMDQEPTHWAYEWGFYWNDLLPISLMHNIAIEYRYLSKWVYTVADFSVQQGERYTYLNRSLGQQTIDGDKFSCGLNLIGKNYWAVTANIEYSRQDTNTIRNLWKSNTLGYRKETPLSQRAYLKTTIAPNITLHCYWNRMASMDIGWINRFVKERNKANHYTYDPSLNVNLHFHFSKGFYFF